MDLRVAVGVTLFNVSENTKLLPPVFPLLFHERFHFQKTYRKADCLPELEDKLARVPVCLELRQYPEGTSATVRLAVFKARLGDLLFPPAGGDLNLMFSPTKSYPGIIAPVAEVTTRLGIQEAEIEDGTKTPLPVTIYSRGAKKEPATRQRPVCHTKHYLYCSCFANGQPRRNITAPTNKRRKSGDWIKKELNTIQAKSHRNSYDDIHKPTLRPCRSESSLDIAVNRNIRNPTAYQRDQYQIDDYVVSETNDDIFTRTKDRLDIHYHGQQQRPHKHQHEHYPMDNRDPCDYYKEDVRNDQHRRSKFEKDIEQLKKELKALLDEEEKEENARLKKTERPTKKKKEPICCLCCPKERQNQGLMSDGRGRPCCSAGSSKEETTSCSECFVEACKRAHKTNTDSIDTTLEDDIRRRPQFYSNLYAAYEKLRDKKRHKKPWR